MLNLCAVRYPTLSPLASCWCGSRGCDRSVAARWHVCPSFHACDEMPGSQLAYRTIASRPASLGDMEITQEMLRGDAEENKAPSRPSWPRYPRPGCARSRILPQECWSRQRIPGECTWVPAVQPAPRCQKFSTPRCFLPDLVASMLTEMSGGSLDSASRISSRKLGMSAVDFKFRCRHNNTRPSSWALE